MSPEGLRIKIERVDYHFLPTKGPDTSILLQDKEFVPVRDIGGIRVKQGVNGYLSGVAKLLSGVVVRHPDNTEYKVSTLPNAPARAEPILLAPQEEITFTRKRFARGKTVVTLTNLTT